FDNFGQTPKSLCCLPHHLSSSLLLSRLLIITMPPPHTLIAPPDPNQPPLPPLHSTLLIREWGGELEGGQKLPRAIVTQ
ncbi:hypothetical protein NQZ68_004854, partial [Dissostichus eleginoides]